MTIGLKTSWCEERGSNPHAFRHRNLNPPDCHGRIDFTGVSAVSDRPERGRSGPIGTRCPGLAALLAIVLPGCGMASCPLDDTLSEGRYVVAFELSSEDTCYLWTAGVTEAPGSLVLEGCEELEPVDAVGSCGYAVRLRCPSPPVSTHGAPGWHDIDATLAWDRGVEGEAMIDWYRADGSLACTGTYDVSVGPY